MFPLFSDKIDVVWNSNGPAKKLFCMPLLTNIQKKSLNLYLLQILNGILKASLLASRVILIYQLLSIKKR